MRDCWLWQADRVPYQDAWAWQKALVATRRADPSLPDALLLLEHPPVYTLGQGAR
jgi:lipoyl(octanoyl) transferase